MIETRSRRNYSAPGNLLIFGEYLITEEGGRGLAVAASPRATLSLRPSENLSVESRWPGGNLAWTRNESPSAISPPVLQTNNALADAVISAIEIMLS